MAIYHIRPDRFRPPGWRILTLADVEFYVEPSFLWFIGIIFLLRLQNWGEISGSQMQAVSEAGLVGFVIFFSLLAHEAGHALTARMLGAREIFVSLIFMGGLTRHPPATRGRSLAISAAGPLASLALVAGSYGLLHLRAEWMQAEVARFIAVTFFWTNLVWAIFNLLPIFPMDGGKIVLYGLTFLMREGRAMLATALVSLLVCAALGAALFAGVFGPVRQHFIAIYFLFTFVGSNLQILRDNWPR